MPARPATAEAAETTGETPDSAARQAGGKGRQTHAAILEAGLVLAARKGLDGVTIGDLAEATGMSKSGVFAHFGSRDDLLVALVREYERRFSVEVVQPALQAPRGLPRLQALFDGWVHWLDLEVQAGRFDAGAVWEFAERPGPVHEAIVQLVAAWHATLIRAIEQARAERQLRADINPEQMRFEMHGLMLSAQLDARVLKRADAFERARLGMRRLLDGALPLPAA